MWRRPNGAARTCISIGTALPRVRATRTPGAERSSATSSQPGSAWNDPVDPNGRDDRPFSDAQCQALFDAVLIDDEVDAHTELPARITLDHDPEILWDCYRISRQLWAGVDLQEMIALNAVLRQRRTLASADRFRFKYARAKFKHLRFACALYGERHAYPTMLDWMTTALGHLQDAFKLGLGGKVYREALLCRVFLARGVQAILRRQVDHLAPTSVASFRAYVARQIATLEEAATRDVLTGAQFHASRKIASRLVSFYDTLRIVAPSDEAFKMSRSLAAINGLMGAMHDELIERRVAGTQDYHHDSFGLPEEIRARISALVERYRMSGL